MNVSEDTLSRHGIRRGDWRLMADMNRNLVVNVLRAETAMSRADLVRATHLSGPTVSAIVTDLVARGLVEEVGQGQSSGGRRPSLLRLKDDANHVVGLKLSGQSISLVMTDLRAEPVYSQVTPLPEGVAAAGPLGRPSRRETAPAVESLCAAVEAAIASSGADRSRILGVGIALAGAVDATSGLCHFCPTFDWHEVQLGQPIAERLGLPVVLENDSNALTAAEQWFGSGHGVDHFVVLVVGAGVGAGIVVNGQLHRGADGAAGEFGHIRLGDDGPQCSCGKTGCVEAWASDRAIVRDLRAAVEAGVPSSLAQAVASGGPTIAEVGAAADSGDELSQKVLARAGEQLGRGAAALIDVVNPRLVIVSGEGVPAGEWRFGAMRRAIARETFGGIVPRIVMHSEPVDGPKWARGAACVVLGELFSTPTKQSLVGAM